MVAPSAPDPAARDLPLRGFAITDADLTAPAVAEAVGLLTTLGADPPSAASRSRVAPSGLTLGPALGRAGHAPGWPGGRGPGGRWPGARAVLLAPVGPLPGLPGAVPARAAGTLLALAALAAARSGGTVAVDPADVVVTLLLPAVMAASYDAPPPSRPTPLRWRDGWLAAELGAPGDVEAFARLVNTLPPDAGVVDVATQAQVWRLPVVPYQLTQGRQLDQAWQAGDRPAVDAGAAGGWAVDAGAAGGWAVGLDGERGVLRYPREQPSLGPGDAPLAGVRVLDASVMWAGPLATWLLAGLGAQVTTLEPAARPDGTRAPEGGGIYPHGVLVSGDGSRSAMFNALARGKRRWDLDLRTAAAVAALTDQVRRTDLVIDNLSPRARGQLGLTAQALRSVRPDLVTVTIPAFAPSDRRRSWVAYGSQVHALSGLAWGDLSPAGDPADAAGDPPVPAAAAYADAITGLRAALVALAALIGRDGGWRPAGDIEVPLMASVDGLAAAPGDARRLRADAGPTAAAVLREHADRFEPVVVDGERLAHPRHPWTGWRPPGIRGPVR